MKNYILLLLMLLLPILAIAQGVGGEIRRPVQKNSNRPTTRVSPPSKPNQSTPNNIETPPKNDSILRSNDVGPLILSDSAPHLTLESTVKKTVKNVFYSDELLKLAQLGDASAQYELGECYFKGSGISQSYEKAIGWFRESANQEYVLAQYALAVCYMDGLAVAQSKILAISWFEKAIHQGLEETGQDWTINLNRFERYLLRDTELSDLTMLYVMYLIANNKHQESRPVLRKLLQIDPTNSSGRMMLLQDAVNVEDYAEIINLCEAGVEASPDVLEFYYYLAIAYAHEKRNDDVIRTCKAALEHTNEQSTKEVVSDFYSMLGYTYHTKGDLEQAYEAYEKAIEQNANNISALNNYAYYLSLERRDLDRAEEMSYKTVKAEPEDAIYLDTYSWILFLKGNYKRAKLYIEKALKSEDAQSADIMEHCGDIYFKTGDTAGALEYWQKALELGSSSTKLKQKISQKKYLE